MAEVPRSIGKIISRNHVNGLADFARLVIGNISNGSNVSTEKRGQLNPKFSCWLMGFPDGYSCSEDMAMRSSRKSPPSS